MTGLAAASGGDTGAQQVSLLENIDRGIGKVVGNTRWNNNVNSNTKFSIRKNQETNW